MFVSEILPGLMLFAGYIVGSLLTLWVMVIRHG